MRSIKMDVCVAVLSLLILGCDRISSDSLSPNTTAVPSVTTVTNTLIYDPANSTNTIASNVTSPSATAAPPTTTILGSQTEANSSEPEKSDGVKSNANNTHPTDSPVTMVNKQESNETVLTTMSSNENETVTVSNNNTAGATTTSAPIDKITMVTSSNQNLTDIPTIANGTETTPLIQTTTDTSTNVSSTEAMPPTQPITSSTGPSTKSSSTTMMPSTVPPSGTPPVSSSTDTITSQSSISTQRPSNTSVIAAKPKGKAPQANHTTVAMAVCIPLVVLLAIGLAIFIYRKKRLGPRYITLDDYGNYTGSRNPSYEPEL